MKKLLTVLFILCIFFSCDIRNNSGKNELQASAKNTHFNDSTSVEMIDSIYNFGKVVDGENVTYSFRFKNSGNKPLVISAATASCGCTVPEKPEEPVKPGETGVLKVVFNSKGRVGQVHKEVNVVSNAYPKFPVLQIVGEVLSTENKS